MADDGSDSDEFETELNADSEIDEVLLDIREPRRMSKRLSRPTGGVVAVKEIKALPARGCPAAGHL